VNLPKNISRNISRNLLTQIALVAVFLSLKFLLNGNMGRVNEMDILAIARQQIDPQWIPQDWYLNLSAGYRLPFFLVFGQFAVQWGFLATSIVGRLIIYTFISTGLTLIGRKLNLSLLSLLVAIALFAYPDQGVIADEWIVGGLEPKVIAYGWLLLAIRCMLDGHYLRMSLLLGLATTFHTLVGGWAVLVVSGWLILRRREVLTQFPLLLWGTVIYLGTSSFAIWTALDHLSTPSTGSLKASYLYVFLRLPHHVNPLSWHPILWLEPLAYWILFAVSVAWIGRSHPAQPQSAPANPAQTKPVHPQSTYHTAFDLAWFVGVAWIPFLLGVAIAPLDQQGQILQYHPFRLGDTMLPLITGFLFAYASQQGCTGPWKVRWRQLKIAALGLLCFLYLGISTHRLLALQAFPITTHRSDLAWYEINSEWKGFCDWVRLHVPPSATVITPPVELASFTWLAERATIAKYRFVPPTAVDMLEWYDRISNLSGGAFAQLSQAPHALTKAQIRTALSKGYHDLTTAQAQALMDQYNAAYFMTQIDHQLDLAIAHQTTHYVLYQRGES